MPWIVLADAWAVGTPSLLGGLGGAAVLGLALVVMARLGGELGDPEPSSTALGTLGQLRALRADVQRRLDGAPPARRAVLEHLLAPVLADFDRQATQRERDVAQPVPDAARHAASRAELEGRLASEHDPRARALLEASLADLDQVQRVDAECAQRVRVAEFELLRLRTLLERLLSQLDALEHGPSDADWESTLVTQFEEALHATQDVLEA